MSIRCNFSDPDAQIAFPKRVRDHLKERLFFSVVDRPFVSPFIYYTRMPEIDFDGSGADERIADLIEHDVRKATESLRCPDHFPGRFAVRVDGAHVGVVSACCDPFLQKVKDAIADALA